MRCLSEVIDISVMKKGNTEKPRNNESLNIITYMPFYYNVSGEVFGRLALKVSIGKVDYGSPSVGYLNLIK